VSPQTESGTAADAPVLDAENPWPGLAPFSEDQAVYFHGRRKEVEDLFRLVRLNPLTVLYGQSGLGKTSLLQAALFPRLRAAGYLPVLIRLHYAASAPGPRAQLWQALAAGFEAGGVSAPPLGDDETLWEYFHRRSLALTDGSGNAKKPVLIFDQFEELFTLGAERADGGGFVRDSVAELAALIENHPPDRVEARFNREPRLVAQFDFDRQDHRVLLSLREDYLAHLHDLGARIPSITLNNMRVTPLDGPRALDAVEKPGGALVTPDVAEAIVRFVAGSAEERKAGDGATSAERRMPPAARPIEALVVDPSLLSLFCRELNQKRRAAGERRITPALVAESSENILNEFYEHSLSDLPEGARVFVEDELLTPSGFRETIALETARSELAAARVPAEVLDALVARRLLHYELRGRDTRVELTHDVLTKVVSASRDQRRAVEAERQEKLRLQEAESRARAAQEEARAELLETQARQRKLRVLAGALAVLALLAGIQTFRASSAKDRANVLQKAAEDSARVAREQRGEAQRLLAEATEARRLAQSAAQSESLEVVRERSATATAVAEKHRADTLRLASTRMLGDFCGDQLRTINSFDFGEATSGRADLVRTYISLLETSDSSIEHMIARDTAAVCPRLLDARVESVLPGLLMQRGQRGDTASARARGRVGVAAARRLAGFGDTLSRQVAAQSLYNLTYDLYFALDDSTSLAAGRAALPLLAAADPRRDSLALDRLARVYHYGALSLLHFHRPRDARAWVDTGLTVVARGRARPDQLAGSLLYTESQLQLVLTQADSVLHDTTGALAAGRASVAAARVRHERLNRVGTLEWLAKMHKWNGDLIRSLGRPDEAFPAYDSSLVQWGRILRQGRSDPDTSMIVDGFTGIINALNGAADTRIASKRWDEAAMLARTAIDSAQALARVRPTASNRVAVGDGWTLLGSTLEKSGHLAAADSAYREKTRIDSTMFAQNIGDRTAAVGRLGLDLGRLRTLTDQRETADTAGQDSVTAARTLRAWAEIRRRDGATRVWYLRRMAAVTGGTTWNDDLANGLGSLSWSDLLTDRPEEAVLFAQEGDSLSKKQSFILPNLFNALLLSGRDEEAARFFQLHSGEKVETTPVPFPCAVRRDILELQKRGVALDRHVQVVERLVTPFAAACRKPSSPGTR
jgi:conflict system STAND superfamily ATPase